jgi:orotidine-5'-phosphate decarboxylase
MFEVEQTKDQKPKPKDKIIVALDVSTAKEAREIIDELREDVGAFKIGLQLFSAVGASFVQEVVADGIKLFLDVKFHDIPNTVAKASVEVAQLGVWMFNIHAIGGGEMMRKTVEEVRQVCDKENLTQPKIIGVTVLTSSNQATLREVGIEKEIDAQVLNLAQLSAKCGLDGVVASPHEARIIRQNIGKKDFLIVTPGVRSRKPGVESRESFGANQIETNDDQKRVMTPAEAICAGADYLVIGRPILQAEDKCAAVQKILAEIETTETLRGVEIFNESK